MKISRAIAGASVIAAGLLVSGCVSSGYYGAGPMCYGGYGGVYSQRYVCSTPRVVTGPRYRYYRPGPVYGPGSVYWGRPVYRANPYYGPRGRYYWDSDRYER